MVDFTLVVEQAEMRAGEASVLGLHAGAFSGDFDSAIVRDDLLLYFEHGLLPAAVLVLRWLWVISHVLL